MSDTEIFTRMCVRYGWSEQEHEERRRRATAMQEKLLRSIVRRSIESRTGGGRPVPCSGASVEGFSGKVEGSSNKNGAGSLYRHGRERLLA